MTHGKEIACLGSDGSKPEEPSLRGRFKKGQRNAKTSVALEAKALGVDRV
jgi:hypothetical protein